MTLTHTTPIHLQRSTWPVFWLLISLLIFTACLGGGGNNQSNRTGDVVLLEQGGQGKVVCSAACLQWGQCGAKTDGSGNVVLAGRGGPTVVNHELIFPAQTSVLIDGQEVRTLQPISGGDPISMNFYYVVTADGTNKGGWVAGWCVQAAQ
ncbi:MAG: hypothetical protein H6658_08505 [Ardenticatenaceae bacterium]|nr:hypothetical protein [Ardenticatenaceae bacterium]